MARRLQVTVLAVDAFDVRAYQRDLWAIVLSYGAFDLYGDGVQPHRLAAFHADVERAGKTFKQCIQQITGDRSCPSN